jgi:hypothetical protein
VEELARLVIGIIFVALFINLMKRGPDGVKEWWRAKFLGQVAAK